VRTAIAALVLGLLAGCGTLQSERLAAGGERLPTRAEVEGVPFYAQTRHHCGPAALATALGWTGMDVAPEDLANTVFTPGRAGSLPTDVLATARRHGRLAVPVSDMAGLVRELAAGHPVVVLQNLGLDWYPQWHYAVAVAFDLDRGEIALRSGTERRRVISLSTFERTWARSDHWGVVVLPPDRLPVSADRTSVLQAAAGLERAGDHDAARTAYGAILERWPGSLAARIGLANARYASGDPAGAERALRAAVLLHPEAGAAWNNLAHVLAERGRRQQAIAAARRATRIDDAHRTAARRTLEALLQIEHAPS